jgi:pyruvate dehydrogenase E1 component alpha subunit
VWKHRDPIERVKSLLVREFRAKSVAFEEIAAEAETLALKLRDDVLAMGRPDPQSMFDDVYAAPHPLIDEGRRQLAELVGGGH